MQCAYCRADTRVVKSRTIRDGLAVSRSRECLGTPRHRFLTVEGEPHQSIERTAVRRTGDGQLAPGFFDRDRLYRDLQRALFGRLTTGQMDTVVSDAVADLERSLPKISQTLDPGEGDTHPNATGWIADHAIATAIESQLRRSDRMALVLYALSVQGRRDHAGRPGWKSARSVIEWLNSAFPLDLKTPTARVLRPATWRPPAVAAPHPQVVVKRQYFAATMAKPVVRLFDSDQFLRSIDAAFSGRKKGKQRSALVREWVLWGLAGQQVVTSAQLSAAVLECLRRVDDIAYLRWAASMKQFDSVRLFAGEALALIQHPSQPLKLRQAERPLRGLPVKPSPLQAKQQLDAPCS